MSTVVTQANEQLREAILAALGEAVAAGELPGEPIPAFVIEIPADRSHGDLAANVAIPGVRAERENTPSPGNRRSSGRMRENLHPANSAE